MVNVDKSSEALFPHQTWTQTWRKPLSHVQEAENIGKQTPASSNLTPTLEFPHWKKKQQAEFRGYWHVWINS